MPLVPRIEENILLNDEDSGQVVLLIVRDVTWRRVSEVGGFVPFLDVEVLKSEEAAQRKRMPVRV